MEQEGKLALYLCFFFVPVLSEERFMSTDQTNQMMFNKFRFAIKIYFNDATKF